MYIYYSIGNNSGPRTPVCIVEVSVIGGVHFRRFHCSRYTQPRAASCITHLYHVALATPPEREYVSWGRAWYLKHDVTKIGLKQKGNVLHVFQPTMFNGRRVWYSYLLPFSYSESQVRPHTIKVFPNPLYPWQCSREKKYQTLHACTTLMFALWSMGAWEQG